MAAPNSPKATATAAALAASTAAAGRLVVGRCNSPVAAQHQQTHRQHVQQAAATIFGYTAPPEEPNMLNRDVWRFVQRLDLSTSLKNPRRDVSNGYVVAEMLSRFYASDITMHSFQNGTSDPVKRDNFEQVKRVAEKHDLHLPDNLIEGSIKGTPGAAVSLLECLYEQLTGKKVQKLDPKQLQQHGSLAGMSSADAAAALAATATAGGAPAAADAAPSFGEPADTGDTGGLRAIKAAGSTGAGLAFGAVSTEQAGSAAAVRKKFA